jgi:hypothetical protein
MPVANGWRLKMRAMLMAAAAMLMIGSGSALAQSDEVCPSGQVNTNPAGSPVKCEIDATATTPAPDVVEDAAEVVKDAGDAVKDAGEAVTDAVSDTVKDIAQ